MSGFRRFLYALARILGDAQAVSNGRIAQRAGNKVIGRGVSRLWF